MKKMRMMVAMGAALMGAAAAASPAWALTAIFTPATGANFRTLSGSFAPGIHRDGSIQNDSTSTAKVGANLGGANGGVYTVTIFGSNNGGTLTCKVVPLSPQFDGALPMFSGSTNANGAFSMNIPTSLPGQFIFYTVECTLPGIVGANFARIAGAFVNG